MDYRFVPSGPLLCSSLHAPIAYSSTTPTWQKCRGQWFPFIVKCLQAAQWASWCFCNMRWASGFVAGQLWWREAFYCAVRSYAWPLPGYKCLGRALKGPARASLPHTALQAILTQVRTHRHGHTNTAEHPPECTGTNRHLESGPTPLATTPRQIPPQPEESTKTEVQSPNEPPT